MFILGIPLPLNVPIFDCADYVAFIRAAKLDLDLVTAAGLRILEQEVKSSRPWLGTLAVFQDEITKPKNRRILGNPLLHPLLI